MKQLRSEKGYSYNDLSKLTGLAKSTLQRYETGTTTKIPIDAIETIANALQVPPHELAGLEYFDMKDYGNPLTGLKELESLENYITSLGYTIEPASQGAVSGSSQEEAERLAMEADSDPNFPCWDVTPKDGETFTVSLAEHKQLIRRVKNLIALELRIIEEYGYFTKQEKKTPGATNTKDLV